MAGRAGSGLVWLATPPASMRHSRHVPALIVACRAPAAAVTDPILAWTSVSESPVLYDGGGRAGVYSGKPMTKLVRTRQKAGARSRTDRRGGRGARRATVGPAPCPRRGSRPPAACRERRLA